jgi:hypothetical protein
MDSAETRRRIAFALALATLVAGAAAMALLDRVAPVAEPGAAPHPNQAPAPHAKERKARPAGRGMLAATHAAERFLRAYLRYEAGTFRTADREALVRFSTAQLGGQLLRAPVRIPAGSRAPRQFLARIAAAQVSLFEGRPALLLSALVAGRNGAHLLKASVVKQPDGWVVAGVGP